MQTINALEYGKHYHIYNRGNNREDIFKTDENHRYFLLLYEKYICPVADTFAWVLMRNHFHLLVRIKERKEIDVNELPTPVRKNSDRVRNPDNPDNPFNPDRVPNPVRVKEPKSPHLYFSDLFNAYTQAFNKMHHRTGALFERPFKRIEITSEQQFMQVVVYIHTNPVHHKIMDDYIGYTWSGYQSLFSTQPSIIKREQVIEWFGNCENITEMHNQKMEMDLIENIVLE
jgi:putative transposase